MLIPFVVGSRSPNGLEHQQQSGAQWKRAFDKAPMALGSLPGIGITEIIEDSRTLKMEIASIYPDVDDRICENYRILLAMAAKVGVAFLCVQIRSIIISQYTAEHKHAALTHNWLSFYFLLAQKVVQNFYTKQEAYIVYSSKAYNQSKKQRNINLNTFNAQIRIAVWCFVDWYRKVNPFV